MSKNEGPHGPQGPWAQKHKIIKILKNKNTKIMKITGFFEHGKAAHRNSAAGALNESSRSLIWSFWEQKVFLEICEKVQKLLNLDQFWVHPR